MKKTFALLLALCLLLTAVPAFAAPTRDNKAAEITVDDNLTYLTELIVNAAILQGMPAAESLSLSKSTFTSVSSISSGSAQRDSETILSYLS